MYTIYTATIYTVLDFLELYLLQLTEGNSFPGILWNLIVPRGFVIIFLLASIRVNNTDSS